MGRWGHNGWVLQEPVTDEQQGNTGRNAVPKRHFRLWLTTVIAVAAVALLLAFVFVPVPYVIQKPGPTVDVLGVQGDTQVFEFGPSSDPSLPVPREPNEDGGQLRMVTVSELGGPGSTVTALDVVRAWLTPSSTIRKYSELYDSSVTAEDIKEAGAAQMTSSHSSAAIAAMEYLGVPFESTLTIQGAVPDSDGDGKFEQGDILVNIETPDGVVHQVDRPSVPFDVMKTVPPESTVVVAVDREGTQVEIPVVTAAPPEGDSSEGSKMGIFLTADSDLPIDVQIHLERIGGPSAGLIFALGIVDQLTPGGITGGQVIAGTGAMSFAGDVIPIGGVKQKMYGALRDGAQWFLVPELNCPDVEGNIPDGLRVIPVSTLSNGVGVVEAIASGDTDNLPSCPEKVS